MEIPAAIRYNRSCQLAARTGRNRRWESPPMTARDTLLCIIPGYGGVDSGALHPGIIVQIEEWERRAQGTKMFQPDHNLWKLLHKQVLAR